MSMTEGYWPKWGLPLQVLEFLQANPDESLAVSDVAAKFGASSAAGVITSLRPSVQADILRREHDQKSGLLVYVLGTAARQGRCA